MRAVQQLAGHADLRMTERYSHLAERVLAAAVQSLPLLPSLPKNGNGHEAPDGGEAVPGLVDARAAILHTA